jgi:hypothetical protein
MAPTEDGSFLKPTSLKMSAGMPALSFCSICLSLFSICYLFLYIIIIIIIIISISISISIIIIMIIIIVLGCAIILV